VNLKRFGKTGAMVSEIGMGTWYDSAWMRGAREGQASEVAGKIKALQAGLDGGMNFIDTAEIYQSEPLVGKAIRGRKRDELFIATKVWQNHLHRDDLVRALEKSLKNLGLSYVDLYQVHWPNSSIPIAETMAAMEESKDRGLLRTIGVSNFSLREMTEANSCLKKSEIASNQVSYSLEHRDPERELVPYCEKNKIAVIAYLPLGHGSLAAAGPKTDAVCKRNSKTPAQVALNWLVSKPAVFAIPRASNEPHVREDLGASGWKLSRQDLADLERSYPL
jgi:diketogulonate reductase-like aldo/keto reductase